MAGTPDTPFRFSLKSDSPMSAAYLDKLNPDQRRAVEHGVGQHGGRDPATGAPPALLVIAGAGSGKTSTLAHRVVHLAAHGVDLRRILLMTFSRRAAIEMTRRVIGNETFGANRPASGGAFAGALTGALSLAGTFHAIGARLLREYAPYLWAHRWRLTKASGDMIGDPLCG
jgi:DNA helicase-2/ATP-dependent DNA helicase PcrA